VLYYHHLWYVKADQGDYEKAIQYYKKALEIWENTLPPNHPLLATSYNNNIDNVYNQMEEYSKARSFYEKNLEISQKNLSPNHPLLATTQRSIERVKQKL
jgi:tetratricopeptide (TPR) repeat protein